MYISYPYIWEIWVGVIVSVPHALSYEIFLSEGCKFSQLNLWEISQNHEIHVHSKQRKNNQCYPLPPKNDFLVFQWSLHWTQQVTTRPGPQIKVNPINSWGKSLKKTTPYSMLHNQTQLFQAGKIYQDTRSQISLVGY